MPYCAIAQIHPSICSGSPLPIKDSACYLVFLFNRNRKNPLSISKMKRMIDGFRLVMTAILLNAIQANVAFNLGLDIDAPANGLRRRLSALGR